MTKACSDRDCRESLLDAATSLFNERGYQDVSTREIADAAGVNLGLIQYYFGSKAKLFIETVQRMLQENPCLKAGLVMEDCPECPVQCADKLCEFILAYLEYLIRPSGPQPCKLMYRELNNETVKDASLCSALLQAVSDDFLVPVRNTLVEMIRVVTPESSEEVLEHHAFSIMGQCSFYQVHRPAIERIWKISLADPGVVERLGSQIAQFSLRALGSTQEIADGAIQRVFQKVSK